MTRAATLCAILSLLFGGPTPVGGQGREVHGEGSVFAGEGVVVVWGVLRGPVEEETQVVLRIAVTGQAHAYLEVDAVDPFSRARRPVQPGHAVGGALDVRSPRAAFADFPRREIRFYPTAEAWRAGAPALTVYYLGVPDTTPEFTSEAALLAYLTAATTRARPAAGRRTP